MRIISKQTAREEVVCFGRTNMDPGPSSVPGVLLMLHHNQYNLTVYERYDIKIRVSPGFNGFPPPVVMSLAAGFPHDSRTCSLVIPRETWPALICFQTDADHLCFGKGRNLIGKNGPQTVASLPKTA